MTGAACVARMTEATESMLLALVAEDIARVALGTSVLFVR